MTDTMMSRIRMILTMATVNTKTSILCSTAQWKMNNNAIYQVYSSRFRSESLISLKKRRRWYAICNAITPTSRGCMSGVMWG